MGRTYAGILGSIAFVTVLTRGLIDGSDAESTLRMAIFGLAAFSLLGYVVGQIANSVVLESVKKRFDEHLREREHKHANVAQRV